MRIHYCYDMNNLFILYLAFYSLSISQKESINPHPYCNIVVIEKTKNPLKKYLQRHLDSKIIRDFVNDSSETSVLSIIDQDTVFSSYNFDKWNTSNIHFSKKQNREIRKQIHEFSKSKSILTVKCPPEFGVSDGLVTQFIWIKHKKEITFLFYSPGYSYYSLLPKDQKLINSLNKIHNAFKN